MAKILLINLATQGMHSRVRNMTRVLQGLYTYASRFVNSMKQDFYVNIPVHIKLLSVTKSLMNFTLGIEIMFSSYPRNSRVASFLLCLK